MQAKRAARPARGSFAQLALDFGGGCAMLIDGKRHRVRSPPARGTRRICGATVGREVRMEAVYVILPAVALTVYAALMAVTFG